MKSSVRPTMFAGVPLILLTATAIWGQISDRERISQTFQNLLSAYAKGDAKALGSQWEPSSPFRQDFLDMAGRMFANAKDIKFEHVEIANWRVDPPKAEITVQFDWIWATEGGKPTAHQILWEVRFVERRGQWVVAAWRSISEEVVTFANAMLKAKDHDARAELLKKQREFVVPAIVSKMNNAGVSAAKDEKYDDARHFLEVALELAETLGDRALMASAHLDRGGVYFEQKQYSAALEDFEVACAMFEETQDRVNEAKAYLNRGGALAELGRSKEAEDALNRSHELANAAGDKSTADAATKNIGVLRQRSGDHSSAIRNFAAIEQRMARNGPSADLAGLYIDLGTELAGEGLFDEALQRLEAGRKMAEQVGSVREARRANLHLGTTYLALGKLERAEFNYDKAIPPNPEKDLFIRAMLDEDKLAGEQVLTGLGNIYLIRQEYTFAAMAFYMTRLIAESLHDNARLARARVNEGVVFDTAGEHEKALGEFNEAEKLLKELGNWQEQAALQINKGFLRLDTNDPAAAVREFDAARSAAEEHADANLLFRALWGLGAAYRVRHEWEKAVASLNRAAGYIEKLRQGAPEPLLRASYFKNYSHLFALLVDSLMHSGGAESISRAFEASERAKARSLLELMRAARGDTRALSDEQRTKLVSLRDRATLLAVTLNREEAKPARQAAEITKLNAELSSALAEYQDYELSLKRAHAGGGANLTPTAPDVLRELGGFLNENPTVVVLSYVAGSDASWVFALTKGGNGKVPKVEAVPLQRGNRPFGSSSMESLVQDFLKECSQPYGDYEPYAKELHKLLIAPVAPVLDSSSHLVVIPDGPLNALPFQALISNHGEFLIEEHEISYAPSAAALLEMVHRSGGRKADLLMAAFGRSKFPEGKDDLPWAEKEAMAVARVFGPKAMVYADAAATKARALETMPSARIIHLATHGEFNNAAPLYSGVFLAKGAGDREGFLSAEELMSVDLGRSSLMVVSACESARGEQSNGEGLVGWTWAALVAGLPSVVVSQWALSDDSAMVLMTTFYQNLVGAAKLTEGAALQAAQTELLKTRRHPYYWAPFILTGNWLDRF